MNPALPNPALNDSADAEHWASSEVRLLPDGRILAHHLTPELAAILARVAGLQEMPPPPPTEPESPFSTAR
jgi:hypothetical protein